MERVPRARKEQLADGVTLYLGDCRDIMPTLRGVDHVITDPPYSAQTHRNAKTNRGGRGGRKAIDFEALTNSEFTDIMAACLSIAQGWVVATCDCRHAALFFDSEQFIRLGAWVKNNPMPQISADRPGQGFETVLILHAGKIAKAWNRRGESGVWITNVVNNASLPTEKPLTLISSFVNDFTAPGELVLDPFTGSGTTGVACVKAGRRFIGIEIDPNRFEIALRRISEALARPGFFALSKTRMT